MYFYTNADYAFLEETFLFISSPDLCQSMYGTKEVVYVWHRLKIGGENLSEPTRPAST